MKEMYFEAFWEGAEDYVQSYDAAVRMLKEEGAKVWHHPATNRAVMIGRYGDYKVNPFMMGALLRDGNLADGEADLEGVAYLYIYPALKDAPPAFMKAYEKL